MAKPAFSPNRSTKCQTAERLAELFADPRLAERMGAAGREAVESRWSLERMVEGYQDLIAAVYRAKTSGARQRGAAAAPSDRREPAASV